MRTASRSVVFLVLILFCIATKTFSQTPGETRKPGRAPATPLVTHDPYFSVWSFSDNLNEDWSRHWTGQVHAMCAMARIDGKTYRLAGVKPAEIPAMQQIRRSVFATRTEYEFEEGGVNLRLRFCSPLLLNDIDLASRPVTYITFEVSSKDEAQHEVSIYFDVTAEWVVNNPSQKVEWTRLNCSPLSVLRMGTREQPILQKKGDDLRIDWGYLYLASPARGSSNNSRLGTRDAIGSDDACRASFVKTGKLPVTDDFRMPRSVNDEWPVLSTMYHFGNILKGEGLSHTVFLAYDDLFSIEYFNRKLVPFWNRAGIGVDKLLLEADGKAAEVNMRAFDFDYKFEQSIRKIWGDEYLQIATLAYRQAIAAHKIVADFDGTPLMFSKENFSNGCIGTVDVIYPASPIFLLFNPKLLKAQLDPIFAYSKSPRWKFPFAPHDLGTYPLANGQVYGGGEKDESNQMPVEESANMIIMVAGIAKADENANYAKANWETLTKWVNYLNEKGLDPENQLCTDDFAGHLAHNANLSIKAILAIGAYAQLCQKLNMTEDAAKWNAVAASMVKKWIEMAKDGDHYKLAFDKPGTWSQKYNLVWDEILDLKLFPTEVRETEMKYYKTKINKFGLPLDNRATYTKTDWILWTAAMAGDVATFQKLIHPVVDFTEQTPDRVPFTDWYDTISGKCVGFRARSVIGGVFMPMLKNSNEWLGWVKQSR
ncbi:MAG: glutaminase domain-containing protein [Planctomycetota bacterium]